MARFQAKLDPLVLLAVLAEVLRTADGEHPERVSQRAYNEARKAAGHAATPRADKIAARFGVSWLVLRDRVLHSQDPALALSVASKQQVRRVLTQAEVHASLRRAAGYLGTEVITGANYEEARQAINAAASARHTHGSNLMSLPSANTIRKRMDFVTAVESAGLTASSSNARPTLPRADAVMLFVEHYGFSPHQVNMNWFAKHHRIRMVDRLNEPHSQALAAAAERFRQKGRWFPPQASRHQHPENWQALADGSPDLVAVAERYPRERTQGEGYTLEEIRSAISTAFDLAGKTQRLTAVRYQAIAAKHRLPSTKTVIKAANRNGTSFAELIRDETSARLRANSDA